MYYRLAKIASYKSAVCIEENNGIAFIQIGNERKKIFLSKTEVMNLSLGDVVRVDNKIALIVMKDDSSKNFVLLIGNTKKEMTLSRNGFIPFLFTQNSSPSVEVKIPLPIRKLTKKERREKAQALAQEYSLDIQLAFSVVSGQITLDKALAKERRKKKKKKLSPGEELFELGVADDIIQSFLDKKITFEEAKFFHADRKQNPDLVGSTEDLFDCGCIVPGSVGTGKRR